MAPLWNGYDPNPKQWLYHLALQIWKLYGGAMGGGKSRGICEEIHALCLQFPGNQCLVARENLPELKRSTLRTYLNETLCGEESPYWRRVVANWNKSESILTYRNGSLIDFVGLRRDPMTLQKIRSTWYGAVAIDEATEVTEELANLLETRLRHKLPDGRFPPKRMLLASNPEPGWVKNRFVSQQLEDHIFVPALWSDNADHLPSDYDQRFRFMPEAVRKRYLEGSWDVFEGQVYMDFDPQVHIIPAFDVPLEWPRWRSADYGFVNPQAFLWFAMDWEGNVYLTDELYEERRLPSWWKTMVAAKSGGQHFQETYGCPKFFQTESDGRTTANEYEEGDDPIYFSQAPVGVSARISRVMEFLKPVLECVFPSAHPRAGEPGSPRFFILEGRAPNTVSEMLEYAWGDIADGSGDEVKEVPKARRNHAMEAMERAVAKFWEMSAPEPVRIPTVMDRVWARALKRSGRKDILPVSALK